MDEDDREVLQEDFQGQKIQKSIFSRYAQASNLKYENSERKIFLTTMTDIMTSKKSEIIVSQLSSLPSCSHINV